MDSKYSFDFFRIGGPNKDPLSINNPFDTTPHSMMTVIFKRLWRESILDAAMRMGIND